MGHGLKLMSERDQVKIAQSVLKAAELSNQGMTPSDAIAKVASEENYNPEVINRMVEAFNTSKALAVYEKAAGADRAAEFSQADAREIMDKVFQVSDSQKDISKQKMAKSASEVRVDRNFIKPPVSDIPTVKVASHMETYADNIDRNKVVAGIHSDIRDFRHALDECRREKYAAVQGYNKAMDNLHLFFRYQKGNLEKFAEWESKINRAYGRQGELLMNLVHGNLRAPKVKRASAPAENVYDNLDNEPYCYIQDALKHLKEALEVNENLGKIERGIAEAKELLYPTSKEASDSQGQNDSRPVLPLDVMVKKSGSMEPGEEKFTPSSYQDVLSKERLEHQKAVDEQRRQAQQEQTRRREQAEQQKLELQREEAARRAKLDEARESRERAKWEVEHKDELKPWDFQSPVKIDTAVNTLWGTVKELAKPPGAKPKGEGALPQMSALKDKLRLEITLRDLLRNDPVISKYDSPEVVRVTNQILQFAPMMAQNPMGLKAILRKALEQGGVLESFDVAQEIDAARKLKQVRQDESMSPSDRKELR